MENKYRVDPEWCARYPIDAAAELERLHKWCDELEQEKNTLAARTIEAEKIIKEWIENPQTTQATWDAIRQLGKWYTEATDK